VSGCERCNPKRSYPRLEAIRDALAAEGYEPRYRADYYRQLIVRVDESDEVHGVNVWVSEFDYGPVTTQLIVGVSESAHVDAVSALANRIDTVDFDDVRERVRDIERIVQAALVAAEVA